MRLLALIILFVCSASIQASCIDPSASVEAIKNDGMIFIGPLSIEQVESEHLSVIDFEGEKKKVIFGYINEQWLSIKEHLANGPLLYSISSSEEQWKKPFSGAIKGYGAVKNGCLVGAIITKIS